MSSPFNRLNPFSAWIKNRYALTKTGSTKETYHIVLDLKDSKLAFKVGDSLGIYGDNDPLFVERLLFALNKDPQTPVTHARSQKTMSLRAFLTQKAHISRLTSSFLKLLPEHPRIQELLGDKEKLKTYLATHDVLDFLSVFDTQSVPLSAVVAAFSPLLPRFYSIASSPLTYPHEAHLTVAVSTYMHRNEPRYGVASHFLAHLAEIGKTPIPCYVQPASHFTIPTDHQISIIMIGPGTGIAPFRGFLQERIFHRASGKNWLFFGERHQRYDFFYEEYWHQLVRDNQLKLDVAFSRDQNDKVYVQHKLYERGAEIWNWLEAGAHLYICGETDPMAKDVEKTLSRIAREFGGLSEEGSKQYIQQLRQQKRYLTDIY